MTIGDFEDSDDFDDIDEVDENDETFDTIACPYCKRAIHEDAVRCPHCENYLSALDSPRFTAQPWWIVVGVVVCLLVVLLWALSGA